jgi:hypothetical protein
MLIVYDFPSVNLTTKYMLYKPAQKDYDKHKLRFLTYNSYGSSSSEGG